jgi:virginiamycin B lyase
MQTIRRLRRGGSVAVAGLGALALLLVPSAASAQQKKLKVSVETRSQTQAENQGALKVSYKSKGLNKLSATAKATPSGGSQINFASKATKSNPRNGTLRLRLTNAGEAALEECASLRVRVEATGKPKKSAKASALLAEDDPVCAKPVREFETETSASYPTGMDVGPDGALWFAHSGAGANSLGRMTTGGQYSNFHIPVPEGTPPGGQAGHSINDVITSPDGGIWVTALSDGLFGGSGVLRRVDPATGDVSEFDLGVDDVGLGSKVAVGPDGAMWVTSPAQFGEPALIRVTAEGTATSFPLADPEFPDAGISPYGIAIGGDGGVWFTTPDTAFTGDTAAVGRLDPSTGDTQLFPLSDATKLGGYMTADPAGRLWFTTPRGNTIGRIDPTAPEPQVVEFKIPTDDSRPIGITFATDGSLWFTEASADNIGRYDPASGQFTEYPLETAGSVPFDIVQGDDGKIYFTEIGTGRIGQLDPNKAPTGPPNPSDGSAKPPFEQQGRCPDNLLCQQQVNLTGSTFQIGTALTQVLPPETLKLTAGVDINGGPLTPPTFGPMLESRPLDTVVEDVPAVTRVGLAGPPVLNALVPLNVTVPIDLYVSQPGNPAGGCVIGPVVQNLGGINDEEGDIGLLLGGDSAVAQDGLGTDEFFLVGQGTLVDDAFEVPEARGCGPLTEIINGLLDLPSPSGENAIRLPYTQLVTAGVIEP